MQTTHPTSRPRVVLVLGGTASGKSEFAERYAATLEGSVCYVATAEPRDEEMHRRIERHKARRPAEWNTVEVARDLAARLACEARADVVLVESLGMLLTNHLETVDQRGPSIPGLQAGLQAELEALVALSKRWGAVLIVVSEEVGLSLVPPLPFARQFSDQMGWWNRQTAAMADAVYLVLAGIEIQLSPQTCRGHLNQSSGSATFA